MNNKRIFGSVAYRAALVGISAAILECTKLALAALPNVEVTTLLCALFGYSFGVWGILSAVVFVVIEPLIWGFGTWLVSYAIYWPLVALIFMLLGRKGVRSRILLTVTALMLTFFFGILTALVDVGLFSGYFDKFFYRFGIYYARGIVFYAIQLATNAIVFPTLFLPMTKILSKITR